MSLATSDYPARPAACHEHAVEVLLCERRAYRPAGAKKQWQVREVACLDPVL